MWSGGLIGFVIAFALVIFLIFPAGMLNIKIVDLTVGDVLRIVIGLIVIIISIIIGGNIGSVFNEQKDLNSKK
jgi:tetrahydromethanopterin S-methyltransferase subunit E